MSHAMRHATAKKINPVAAALPPSIRKVFALAVQCHRAGRLGDAELHYRTVLAAHPRHADSLSQYGTIALQTHRPELAADLIGQALAIDPQTGPNHANLGIALRRLGRLDEAAACYRRAIQLSPNHAEAHNNLGNLLMRLGQMDEAVACYRQAIALRPDYADAHNGLGGLLVVLARPDEAVECLRRCLELRPAYTEAHDSLGMALQQQGRLDDAIECYRMALRHGPGYAGAHSNLAMALLAKGEMAEGWKEYEWRWRTPQLMPAQRTFARPQWRGQAAEGKTLLIHSEQGFGDTIHFCRYAPLAAERGFRVVLEVPKRLARLLGSLPGVAQIVSSGETLPPFDLHCPMMSLPLAFRTTVETIPNAIPYLNPDAFQVESWRIRLAETAPAGLRVGLVWAGNPRQGQAIATATDHRRSMPTERLAPLLDIAGACFFSLQKDRTVLPVGWPQCDFMDEMDDFADTAALIANLDLVISVDTAVAHLASAIGKPVWLLDRFDPDWRWTIGGRDNLWYPTIRVYRQPAAGDWDAVVARAAKDLMVKAGQ